MKPRNSILIPYVLVQLTKLENVFKFKTFYKVKLGKLMLLSRWFQLKIF